jgi:methylmalonyl-CoA mutase
MSKYLFDEFQPVSSKQWKQKIQFDLKGADYNKTLIWKTNENIDVKPFYHADDFEQLPNISDTKATQWHILQSIFVSDINKSHTKAIDIIERGAESIKFIIPKETISIEKLIKGINQKEIALFFDLEFLSADYINRVVSLVPNAKFQVDIVGHLAKSGNWFKNLNDDFKAYNAIVKHTHTLYIDASLYQNAGATITQELAYALVHANEYLNNLENSEINLKAVNVIFNVSVSSNYFFEIAKLRVLRTLWKTLALEYDANTNCTLIVAPSKRNKTVYDFNTNMLRTTTECMSAVLGGADFINNLPYDAIYHKSNEFSERIARNQLLILKHESYFNAINNPSDGSYYIETLTNQLSDNTLKLFKDIEKNGGFLSQLKTGTIQRKIKESANKEQEQFNKGEIVLLGTNMHPNASDCMKHELELYPFVKTNPRKTLIEPIIEKRLSENLEQNRLKNEN